ncbi:hypothetical protein CBR_g10781 [Chara braunii]|uniref:Right handed beta helix domain-containing protein n=1 Tax=Chara braunii TaxID=69332 RepID=A0A388KP69_CHABU|nr:hypothetical protein CBR_g10781 [Chara braunii]|eukprot:GBG71842.1 hypothetical protein CBR_g10781 [Chara braunii]
MDDDGSTSYVKKCGFSDLYGSAIAVRLTNGLQIEDNVAFRSYDSSNFVIDGGSNISLSRNLAIGAHLERAVTDDLYSISFRISYFPANFEVKNTVGPIRIQDNAAAGSYVLGFNIVGDDCKAEERKVIGNEAHTNLVGVYFQNGYSPSNCICIDNFKISRSWDYGILNQKSKHSIEVHNTVVAESKRGILLNKVQKLPERGYTLINSTIVAPFGALPAICIEPPNKQAFRRHSYTEKSPIVGIVASSFSPSFGIGPPRKAWDQVSSARLDLELSTLLTEKLVSTVM